MKKIEILISLYRLFISPVFSGLGCRCRFRPTCSQYALDALEAFAFPKAAVLIFRRILRCGPWSNGGFDPIGEQST